MTYGDIQNQDYRTYCYQTWFWRRVSRAKFQRVHAACMQAIAERHNPSRFLASAEALSSPTFEADWVDFLIDGVLEVLNVPSEQRVVWRVIIRFVLQILVSSLLVAQKQGEFGLSEGIFNRQVVAWASEARLFL